MDGITFSCEQGSWAVPATHGIWIPPHHLHAGRSHGPFVGWGVYVAERACSGLPGTPRTVPISGLLRETVHRMASWGIEPHEPARERLAHVMLDEIESLPEEPLRLAGCVPYP
ncbi:hypothetical protein F0U60_53290 [Archangium minus]|uniref:AraC family transcriptional regulator n=1 Tax=Archangium minus TaxID=83450 RepID=A0ABY9X955_9BACT|nr:hypothetical protein F0U60_53290 [Archangium minus]